MDNQTESTRSFLSECASLEDCLERYELGEENYPFEFFFDRFGKITTKFTNLSSTEREELRGAYELAGFELYQVLRHKGYQEKFPSEIQHIVGISGVYDYSEVR